MEIKRCKDCLKNKNLDLFYNCSSNIDGKQGRCKKCSENKRKEKYRDKKERIKVIYRQQVSRCKAKWWPPPKYSKKELIERCLSNEDYHKIYENRASCWYAKDMVPSIDRLNDYETYSFDNIQVLTWEKNREKWHLDKVNWINNKTSRKVYQFNKNWKLIWHYPSIVIAAKKTWACNSTIWECCRGKSKMSWWYYWSYSEDIMPYCLEKKWKRKWFKVYQYTLDMEFVCEYNSVEECAKAIWCTNINVYIHIRKWEGKCKWFIIKKEKW